MLLGDQHVPVAAVALALLLLAPAPGRADVFRDGSLGSGGPGSVPGGNYVDLDGETQFAEHLITETLGERVGGNLFHSFQSFDLDDNVEAAFTADWPTQSILARVIGGRASEINGKLISAVAGADFYFLNPSGVLFGPNAELDVRGDFHVSMADYLRLGSYGRFDSLPAGDTLLTTDPPSAFGFMSAPDNPVVVGEPLPQIRFDKSSLGVRSGNTFSAVGRDAGLEAVTEPGVAVVGSFETGVVETSLVALGGRIQLASVAAHGAGELPMDLATLEPDSLTPGTLGSIELTSFSILAVDSTDGLGAGTVVIRGGRFLMDSGRITADSLGGEDAAPIAIDIGVSSGVDDGIEIRDNARLQTGIAAEGDGGRIRLSGGRVRLLGRGTFVESVGTGSGSSGGAVIEADQIEIRDEAQVLMQADAGSGGDIRLNAGTLLVQGGGSVSSVAGSVAGGDVTIRADSLQLLAGGQVSTQANAEGAAGDVVVLEANDVVVSGASDAGPSGLLSRSEGGATGQGGSLRIEAHTLSVQDGGEISSEASTAQGGSIRVQASHLPESRIDVGSAGQIVARTTGDGAGGSIHLSAETVTVTQGGKVRADTEGSGTGGSLHIEAKSLAVTDVGQISTATLGAGRAGNLSIQALESVLVAGASDDGIPSGIFARSEKGAADDARGGDLRIQTKELLVQEGGQISARTLDGGLGDAGNLIVSGVPTAQNPEGPPADRVRIQGSQTVLSARGLHGNGGSLQVTARLLEVVDGGEISASTSGVGSSGDVDITADEILISGTDPLRNPSGIFARTNDSSDDSGKAGELAIHAPVRLEVSERGQISVGSGGGGISGNITIHAGQVEISSGGEISAASNRAGASGSITVDAEDGIEVAGGAISSQARESKGGDITLSGGTELVLREGAEVSARASGAGEAGSIQVAETGAVRLSDASRITAEGSGSGGAGQVAIGTEEDRVNTLELSGASAITTEMTGSGDGGRIDVSASQAVVLSDASTITARSTIASSDRVITAGDIAIDAGAEFRLLGGSSVNTEGRAADLTSSVQVSGGNVSISALSLVYALDSQITTSVGTGPGEGGEIQIPRIPDTSSTTPVIAPEFVVLNRSEVIAQADKGPGGKITIRAENFVRSSDSIVDASSRFDVDGQVVIASPENSVTTDVVALPSNFVDVTALLASSCAARAAQSGSFVVRPRDWIPPAPDAPLRRFYPGGPDDPAPLPTAAAAPAPANSVCAPELRSRTAPRPAGEGV